MAAHDLKNHLRLGNVTPEFLQILRRSPRSLRFVKHDQSVCWGAAISIAVSNKSMYLANSRAHGTCHALLARADTALQRLLNDCNEWSIPGKERSLLDIKIELLGE